MTNLAKIPDGPVDAATRPLRVAICGEVNSGKSTVANALLRARKLPDLFGTKARPFIHIRSGEDAAIKAVYSDGREETVDELTSEAAKDAQRCDIVAKSPHLEGFEFIEMPFLNERDITDEQVAQVESADLLIWTTIASQAWRLSEKTILDRCEKRPEAAILVVSRADKLRSDEDRSKLMSRMERETGDYFRNIVMMRGKDVIIDAAADDDEAWDNTGAPEILSYLQTLGEEVRGAKARAIQAVEMIAADAGQDEDEAEEDADTKTAEVVELDPSRTKSPLGALAQAVAQAKGVELTEDGDAPSKPAAPAKEVSTEVPASPDLSPQARSKLEALMPALHGCAAVGIAPLGSDDEVEFLKGSADDWPSVGEVCKAMYDADAQLDPAAAGEPLQCHMSLRHHQIMTQCYPRKGAAVFMIAPTARMNHAIARTAFQRLTKAIEQTR